MKNYYCPECKGSGKIEDEGKIVDCYLCNGTGFAVDSDNFQEFWHADQRN